MSDRIIPLHRQPSDYAGPRFVAPLEPEQIARAVGDPDAIYSRRPQLDIDEIERRLREDRLFPLPRSRRSPLLEDLIELWSDIRTNWDICLICAVAGLAIGCFGVLGIAWLIVEVAS